MNQPSSPESEDLPAKPQTLAQCHEVIDTLGQQLAQLREQVAWLSTAFQDSPPAAIQISPPG